MTEQTHYASARHQFDENTKDHEMMILRDEGLYRHVRFKAPGTMMWHFDLITWPGYLAIVGDISEGHIFRRVDDMFEFFRPIQEPWRINAGYWAEKLTAGRSSVKRHSEEQYEQRIREAVAEKSEELEPADQERLRVALDELLYWEPYSDSASAHESIAGFEFDGKKVFSDTWEWDFNDYDHHFILSLFAITWGIEKYRKEKP